MTVDRDLELYRSCVGIMLLNKQGQVFVGQRRDNSSDAWQMPQGGIDAGEMPEQAVYRELLEEIGCNDIEIITCTSDWLFYDLPNELKARLWGGKFMGQKQIWFLAKFLGDDSDINIKTKHPEFSSWRWVDAASLPEIIVPFKQKLYKDIVNYFKPYIELG